MGNGGFYFHMCFWFYPPNGFSKSSTDWIYGFKYPIVIYAITVLVNYFTGYLIDKVNHPVQRYVIGKLFNVTK